MAALLEENGLFCSPPELFTLAALLGGQTLIGIPDPFPGWLAEEIQDVMAQTQQRLAEREVLRRVNNEWRMDAFAALLVGTMTEPQAVLLANLSLPGGELHHRALYARLPFFTELSETPEGGYRLRLLEEGQQALASILEFWQVEERVAPAPGSSFSLPQKTLDQARQSLQQAEALLRPYGPAAATFLDSLRRAQRNGSVVAMRKRNAWQVGGMGFLQAENGLWRLRSFQQGGEDWVEAIPCETTSLQAELRALLQSFWPGE